MKVLARIPLLALLVGGCAAMSQPTPGDNVATVALTNANGQPVGTAKLDQLNSGVRVILEMRGMPPGAHGVHIHEAGKCDPPAFTSAGGHFNPSGKQHGALNPQGSHAGDLPNITIGSDGTGRLESMSEAISIGSGPMSLFDADGSALVVHAGPDDFKTDPAGNSGARIACGVIVKAR
jgi:Cu-Zn family superoxide dismutase